MTKTILDVQISFEYFCDVLKKRAYDPRVRPNITDTEFKLLCTAYQNGYVYSDGLKKCSRTIKNLLQLEPYIQGYYKELNRLEDLVNPIMDKAHKKAGLTWKGRKEAPTIVEEQDTLMRTSHS